MRSNAGNTALMAVLCIFTGLFLFSVFKNISYPLLWNDESETAMFGDRILRYGFPKVDDGKNIVYALELPGKIGIDQKTGAYIGTTWGHFYLAAVGAFFAAWTGDIYLKTMLLRLPFALIGCAGLAVLALMALKLFDGNTRKKLTFLSLFALFELFSVFLALHLREARYYSPAIFLCACSLCLYSSFRIFAAIDFKPYAFWMSVVLFLLCNTFTPAFFSVLFTILAYELFLFLRTGNAKASVTAVLPLCAAAILAIPVLLFFRTFHISAEFSRVFPMAPGAISGRVLGLCDFFKKYEFFDLVILVKLLSAGTLLCCRIIRRLAYRKEMPGMLIKTFSVSCFLALFCFMYIAVIVRIPIACLFVRYYIILQPIITVMLLLDMFVIYESIAGMLLPMGIRTLIVVMMAGLIGSVFFLSMPAKIESIEGHVYELFHRYKGPLDLAIPFIQSRYKHPDRLTIATNYEEYSYMFYIGSKTIIGYVGNNLKEDLKLRPDVIIPRRQCGRYTDHVISELLQAGEYNRHSLPVTDYFCNNIPEPRSHLFRTELPKSENESLEIFTLHI